MRRTAIVVPALIVGMFALVLVGGATAKKPALSATPVFKLNLKPSQEAPPVKGLKADAVGSVTFDLERSTAGAITSGEVIFYVQLLVPRLREHHGSPHPRGCEGDSASEQHRRELRCSLVHGR